MNCRICKKEISDGTLCNHCLITLNDELLTIDERKQRNEMVNHNTAVLKTAGGLMLGAGILSEIMGFLFSPLFAIGIFLIIGGVCSKLIGVFKSFSFCPACQRKKCLEDISRDLIGERQTTVREKRTITQTRKGGKYASYDRYPETYEMDVDVPAVERHYRVTYKCNKCGYVGAREESETVKI